MKVRDVMTTSPITVLNATPVGHVAFLMATNGLEGLPVLAPDGSVVGVVTEDDIIVRNANLHLPTYLGFLAVRGKREFDDEMRHVLATRASDVVRAETLVVHPDDDVADAATLMIENHTSPLLVMENGRLVGVISRSDVVRLLAREGDSADVAPL